MTVKHNFDLACGHRRPNDKTKNQRRRGTKDSRRTSVHKTTGFYYHISSTNLFFLFFNLNNFIIKNDF